MEPTPLLNMLTEKKLNGNNYKEWKRNLIICPPTTQVEARKCWEEYDEIAPCYMLASSCKTAKVFLDKLDYMFGGQVGLVQQSAITSLMNTQKNPNS
ncbi:Polyprotein-like protein [Gossypium australe]|uniref:Polyprotein-like protein n=1 Tax=Gossypium australe TaxID=47621 RepID=A0A5B6VW70_9ROSI|nr:Polyprotein-like protein [Gossypium australe]